MAITAFIVVPLQILQIIPQKILKYAWKINDIKHKKSQQTLNPSTPNKTTGISFHIRITVNQRLVTFKGYTCKISKQKQKV